MVGGATGTGLGVEGELIDVGRLHALAQLALDERLHQQGQEVQGEQGLDSRCMAGPCGR